MVLAGEKIMFVTLCIVESWFTGGSAILCGQRGHETRNSKELCRSRWRESRPS